MGPRGGRRSRWRAGVVLLLVAVQGCWLQSGFGAGRSGSNPLEGTVTAATVAQLDVAWTAPVGGEPTSTVVWRDTAYVRTPGAVTALATSSGEPRWSAPTLGGSAPPAIASNRLWVPTSGAACALVSVDLAGGSRLGSDSYGGPALTGGGQFSSCGASSALAVGSKVIVTWTYLGASPAPGCPEGAFAFGAGVAALDHAAVADGWSLGGLTTGCGTPPLPLPLVPFTSLASDGRLVFVPQGRGLAAYPVADCGRTTFACRETWTRALGAEVGAVVSLDNGDLAVSTADGRMHVLDAATGQDEWSAALSGGLAARVAASSTTIFAPLADGTLAAYPAAGCGQATCDPAWTAATGAPASDQPSVGADVVYVGGTDGIVTALAAAGCGVVTCAPLWTDSVGSRVVGSPVISDGTLYVGGDGGTVTAFALPAEG
jgi:PQQ-like domain